MPTVHLRVKGRVQGVGFRWFVRVAARRLRLSGWVKNHDDGSVEIVAAGASDMLAELKKLVARGHDGAMVTEVVETDGDETDVEYPFAMRK